MKKLLLIKLSFVLIACLAISSVSAQDEKSEPRLFDSFAVQGEYVGDVEVEGETLKAAAQVVARGDDQFDITVYHGGLPGAGWTGERDRDTGSSVFEDGKLVFGKGGDKLVMEDGVMKAYGPADELLGTLVRVSRESETLGKQPPEDAVVLFDGSDGEQFETRDGSDPVEDGLLRQGITSKKTFQDFHLHIEFRLPFEPGKSGQGRGNSGIYLQGRYEIQMLDSFGLEGEHNECGGIYSVRKPDVNMCYPPGAWQTYDIDFTAAKWNDAGEKQANARVTVRHNGVVIHADQEVPKPTTAAPLGENTEPGYLYLQDHGSPVRYRNIWVINK